MSLFVERDNRQRRGPSVTTLVSVGLVVILLGLPVTMYACPRYQVWQKTLQGEAEMKRAESNRRIRVFEAQAKLDSSKLEAQAEIERAKGVAEANKIVADGLKDADEYLRYLWIDKLATGEGREVIYVPTEAGLPILEAGKRGEAP